MANSFLAAATSPNEILEQKPILDKGKPVSKRLGLSIMLEENGPAPMLRVSLVFGFVILFAFLAWAQFAYVDEVSIAPGEVVPSGAVQILQHIDGGSISEIDVTEGQLVRKGEVLVRLDPTYTLAELSRVSTQLVILKMKIARLDAFTSSKPMEFLLKDEQYMPFLHEQKELLRVQQLDLKNQKAVLQTQIEQKKSDKNFLTNQRVTLSKQIAPLEEQLGIRKGLLKNRTLSRFDYLASEREYLKEKGHLDEITLKIASADQAIAEVSSRYAETVDRTNRNALDEMAVANAEAAELEERLDKLRSQLQRLTLYAPVDGVIQGLDVKSIGSVVAPGGAILTVVPVAQELILEVHIRTEDIGHLEVGQDAAVKFTTYNYSRYGSVEGELTHISATTFSDEKGNGFYKGKIRLSKPYVGENPDRNLILPGMIATADIHSGQKTVMEYLLKPIHTTLGQSFRER